jgi:hypothetical protein
MPEVEPRGVSLRNVVKQGFKKLYVIFSHDTWQVSWEFFKHGGCNYTYNQMPRFFFVACPRRLLDIIIITCGIYDLKPIIKSNH